jgi:hypothetical protein
MSLNMFIYRESISKKVFYLTYTILICNFTNHSMVAYWDLCVGGHGIETWTSQNTFISCSRHVILHFTNNYCIKVVYFLKMYYQTPLYDRILSGASVARISKVRSSTMLALSIVGNWKYECRVASHGIMFIQNFIKIRPAYLELNHADRWTAAYGQPFMR